MFFFTQVAGKEFTRKVIRCSLKQKRSVTHTRLLAVCMYTHCHDKFVVQRSAVVMVTTLPSGPHMITFNRPDFPCKLLAAKFKPSTRHLLTLPLHLLPFSCPFHPSLFLQRSSSVLFSPILSPFPSPMFDSFPSHFPSHSLLDPSPPSLPSTPTTTKRIYSARQYTNLPQRSEVSRTFVDDSLGVLFSSGSNKCKFIHYSPLYVCR